MAHVSTRTALAWLAGLAVALLFVFAPARAADGLGLQQQVRQFVVAGSSQAQALRVEVLVGELDPRLRLAPCEQAEPYLPTGTRLWGKARIGVRCARGPSRWNVYLPVTVKVFGPGVISSTVLAAGSVITPGDLATGEVDLAEDPATALADPALAVGRTLARSLAPGESVRASHLRAREWFAAGDVVKVVARGAGFSVSAEGQALTAGVEGQPVRVRTEGGRVLTGLPNGLRRVELAL